MLFSQRKGFKPVRSVIQKNSIDEALRTGLWNVLDVVLWENLQYEPFGRGFRNSNLWELFQRYWVALFNKPLDNLPNSFDDALYVVRDHFFQCEWFEVYDFIEFTAQSAPDKFQKVFVESCNYILKQEMSACRIIDKRITEITAEEEIDSIEAALSNTDKLKGVQLHLQAALALMSDRKSPDFRNSMKESISAVEALAQKLTGDPKATLGAALKALEKKYSMHPALKSSLLALYGYTSDADGIRHAMSDEPNLTFIDAKFMLVACTAFINYLIGKTAESG